MNSTSTQTRSVVLVGGKNAGKTNYLGRLWLALDAETGIIAKNGLPAQVQYLRTIAASLNSGVFAERTAPGAFEPTSIPVKWDNGARFGELVVPDCAGELWDKIHREREWNSGWERAVASMAGCMLFFRGTSDENVEPLNWCNHAELIKYLEQVPLTDGDSPHLPTQVVLTDWLHCLSSAYRGIQNTDQPLRVSIVLSAWDLAPKEARESDPAEYLSANLPMLYDVLLGNPHLFDPKSFGVSISGGVLTDKDTAFMRKYLKKDPNKTGYTVFANDNKICKSNDLTLPLAWAFGCDCPDVGHEEKE